MTTSQKLSTGVDALNVRNIVLLRPVKSMIEFKQIIGRGTRLYEGKYYFTIYDFVKAYENFKDATWDGEPVCPYCGNEPCTCDGEEIKIATPKQRNEVRDTETPYKAKEVEEEKEKPEKLEIRLSDGRARRIKFLKSDMFWGADGTPVSAEDFLQTMFGELPAFFSSVEDLQQKWAVPQTRKELLGKLGEMGYGVDVLKQIRTLIDADDSDLLDVLEYIAYNIEPMNRRERVRKVDAYRHSLSAKEQEFVNYITDLYVRAGVEELAMEKLSAIIALKYGSVQDGVTQLGSIEVAKNTFLKVQQRLYL